MNFVKETIKLAEKNVREGGRPFACIIARGDEIVAQATNQVAQTNDPTAHAEINAIRMACQELQTESLYTSRFKSPCLGDSESSLDSSIANISS